MVDFRATGISSSIYRTVGGHDYLRAGSNITIDSSSLSANGQVIITSAGGGGGGGDSGAAYVVLNATASLSNERVLTGTNGIVTTDGGAGNAFTMQLDGTVARVSGSAFSGRVSITSSLGVSSGITGSHFLLNAAGKSLIAAGAGITVATASDGQVTVTATGAAFTSGSDILVTNFIQQGAAGTQAQSGSIRWPHKSGIRGKNSGGSDRDILTWGTVIDDAVELGNSSGFTSLAGSRVILGTTTPLETSASYRAGAGITGSHHFLIDGSTSLIAGGQNVSVTTASNGQITVTAATGTNVVMSDFVSVGVESLLPVTGAIRLQNQRAIIWANNAAQSSGPSITTLGNNGMQIAAVSGVTVANALVGNSSIQAAGVSISTSAGNTTAMSSGSLTFSSTTIKPQIYPAKTATANATGNKLTVNAAHAVGTGTTKGGDVIILAGTGSQSGGITLALAAANGGLGVVQAGMTLHPSGTGELAVIGLTRYMSASTANIGGAVLPATPEGFLQMTLNGNIIKVPFYNS